MDEVDELVARVINEMHEKDAARVNFKRKKFPSFAKGDVVWYRRPEGTASKMDTRWEGPYEVLAREGEDSYRIKTGLNSQIAAHCMDLKKHWEDTHAEESKPMYFHRRTPKKSAPDRSQFEVQRILQHRLRNGVHQFLTQRVGEDVTTAEYLYPHEFIGEAGKKLLQYCRDEGLQEDLGLFLSGLQED